MNTFLPLQDFDRTASVLHNLHLNKQITEAWQVYQGIALDGPRPGNPHVYTMWREYEVCLLQYGLACYIEWRKRLREGLRGGRLEHKAGDKMTRAMRGLMVPKPPYKTPWWLGEKKIHSSHRAVLLWKNFDWYWQFNWKEEPAGPKESGRMAYWWPQQKKGEWLCLP